MVRGTPDCLPQHGNTYVVWVSKEVSCGRILTCSVGLALAHCSS